MVFSHRRFHLVDEEMIIVILQFIHSFIRSVPSNIKYYQSLGWCSESKVKLN